MPPPRAEAAYTDPTADPDIHRRQTIPVSSFFHPVKFVARSGVLTYMYKLIKNITFM